MTYLKGPDIGSDQGDIDYTKLKVDFIIISTTEGVGFVSAKFKRNQTEARRNSVTLGYYHFARPDLGNTPEAEADYFLKTIGEIKDGELLFLDFEVSFADRVNWCKKWLDRVYAKTNCKAPIYLNQSLMNGSNWKPVIDGGYGLWLAKYDYNVDAPIPATSWPVLAFRQYSNKEKYVGIPSNAVDANIFYGDAKALKAYGYHATPPVPPEQPPDCEKKLSLATEMIKDLENKLNVSNEQLKKASDEALSWKASYDRAAETLGEKEKVIIDLSGKIDLLKSRRYTISEALTILINAIKGK